MPRAAARRCASAPSSATTTSTRSGARPTGTRVATAGLARRRRARAGRRRGQLRAAVQALRAARPPPDAGSAGTRSRTRRLGGERAFLDPVGEEAPHAIAVGGDARLALQRRAARLDLRPDAASRRPGPRRRRRCAACPSASSRAPSGTTAAARLNSSWRRTPSMSSGKNGCGAAHALAGEVGAAHEREGARERLLEELVDGRPRPAAAPHWPPRQLALARRSAWPAVRPVPVHEA